MHHYFFKSRHPLVSLFFSSVFMIGCVSPSEKPVEVVVPQIEYSFVSPSTPLQEKSGIKLSLQPVDVTIIREEEESIQESVWARMGIRGTMMDNSQVTYTPYYAVEPGFALMNLQITNGMNKPLRLAGALVSVECDCKYISPHESHVRPAKLPETDPMAGFRRIQNWLGIPNEFEFNDDQVREIQKVIVLPNETRTITLQGPSLSILPEKANLTVRLFDVITETDAASNPTRRENFEWILSYSRTNEKRQEVARTVGSKLVVVYE